MIILDDTAHLRDIENRTEDLMKVVYGKKDGFDPNQRRNPDGTWGDEIGPFDDTALEAYTFTDSDIAAENLNECLREDCNDEFFTDHAKRINDSLTYLDPYQGVTFRGMSLNSEEYASFMNKINNNDEITFKTFLSTSPDTGVVEGFAFNPGEEAIIFSLKGKTGRDISKYSVYGSDEQEVLFGTGTKWRVGAVHEKIPYPDSNRKNRVYTDIELIEI